jgi:hypothetical protein
MNQSNACFGTGPIQVTPAAVTCAVCQHEVPASEAVVPEATDYVVHFCGLDCYQSWRGSSGEGAT